MKICQNHLPSTHNRSIHLKIITHLLYIQKQDGIHSKDFNSMIPRSLVVESEFENLLHHKWMLSLLKWQSAFVLEENGYLEPLAGGVEIDVNEAEWFHDELESAMVANSSEDEPTLKEALGGCERAD